MVDNEWTTGAIYFLTPILHFQCLIFYTKSPPRQSKTSTLARNFVTFIAENNNSASLEEVRWEDQKTSFLFWIY